MGGGRAVQAVQVIDEGVRTVSLSIGRKEEGLPSPSVVFAEILAALDVAVFDMDL